MTHSSFFNPSQAMPKLILAAMVVGVASATADVAVADITSATAFGQEATAGDAGIGRAKFNCKIDDQYVSICGGDQAAAG